MVDHENHEIRFPFLDRALEVVVDTDVRYYEDKREGRLVVPNHAYSYLTEPIPYVNLTRSFRVVREPDLTLVGFRSYITSDFRFFNDRSILPQYHAEEDVREFAFGENQNVGGTLSADGLSLGRSIEVESIDEPVLCLCSDEPSNYGSWIYRFVPKLIESQAFTQLPILVYHRQPWMRELLRLMYGELDLRFHNPRAAYHIKEAVIPSVRNGGVVLDDATTRFFSEAASRITGYSPLELVYLSRLGQNRKSEHGRVLLNEVLLIEELQKRGFAIIEPEMIPIETQIRIVRDARVIVCPGGAGLFNLVFARSAERVVDLEPSTTWLYAHHNLLRSSGLDHCIVIGKQREGMGHHAPWMIDIEAVLHGLP